MNKSPFFLLFFCFKFFLIEFSNPERDYGKTAALISNPERDYEKTAALISNPERDYEKTAALASGSHCFDIIILSNGPLHEDHSVICSSS